MSLTPQANTQPTFNKNDEQILVVKRQHLFVDSQWQGFKKVDFDAYVSIINAHKEFLPRGLMETDPTYKQIIPYLIFEHENKYFLMQRQSKASETRLQNKFTLGIGGHIRQEDLQEGSSLFDWARREFHEEISYHGNLTIESLGIINDDSNEVGNVHIGFVFLLHGDSKNISIKSELKSGVLTSLPECLSLNGSMETWSQMVVELLSNQTL